MSSPPPPPASTGASNEQDPLADVSLFPPQSVQMSSSMSGSVSTVTTPGATSATTPVAPVPIPGVPPSNLTMNQQLQLQQQQQQQQYESAPSLNISPSRQFSDRPPQPRLHSGTSAGSGLYAPPHHQHSAGGHGHSAPRSPGAGVAAPNLTLFYRHNRHGSNTSLDSSQHFIDHRQQPHSISLNPNSPILTRNMNPASRSPIAVRRGFSEHSVSAMNSVSTPIDAETSGMPSDAYQGHSTLPGPLVDITGEGPMSATSFVRRRQSTSKRSAHSGQSHRDGREAYSAGHQAGVDEGVEYGDEGSPHTISRRSSMLEDDVCFPMVTNQPDTSVHPQLYHGDHEAQEEAYHQHGHAHEEFHHQHGHSHQVYAHHQEGEGGAGYRLPPGYPFTFDMGVLEDFATDERERVRAAQGNESYQGGLDSSGQQTQGGAVPISMSGAGGSGLRNRMGRSSMAVDPSSSANLYGASPDSADATFYVRKPKKMPSVAASANHVAGVFNTHHQSKASPRLHGQDSSGNLHADNSKARNGRLPSYVPPYTDDPDGTDQYLQSDARSTKSAKAAMARSQSHVAMSAAAQDSLFHRTRAGSTPGGGSLPTGAALYAAQQVQSQQERPYRFTFYSNTLPSTIHARYLSEIPAPGQTFEELFSGRRPTDPTPSPPDQGGHASGSHVGAALDGSTAAGHQNGSGSGTAVEPAGGNGASQATSAGGGVPLSRPSSVLPGAGGMPLALPAHLQPSANRMEGNTAPPTGANTPILAQHSLPPAPMRSSGGAASALGLNTALANVGNGAGAGAAGGPPSTAASKTAAPTVALGGPGHVAGGRVTSGPAVASQVTRTYPGGGLRMDQDADANTWWLDVLCPTDAEMKLLSRVFGVHPLTTEDILMEETREKIELFRNYFLVCFRSFDQDPHSPSYLEPVNMYIIVFREGTLSFHFHPTPHPQNVRRRIKQLKDYISVTSDWISYALIDDITDAFGPLIQNIEYEVDSIDELVLILKDVEQTDMLRRIGTCRKKVMGLLRLMGNKADVVKGLSKRCNENWSVAPKSDIGLYLSDIQDHLITMTQNLNHYEKILSRSHSNYLAQISIEMTDANNQINDVLSKLTALGTIIVPMNVITGLWGMNVNVPGQGVENLHWFAGICGVLAVLAVTGYYATIRYLQRG